MKSFLILSMFLFLTFTISADTTVSFIEGTFEVKTGTEWHSLSPGDTVQDGSVLRVGKNTTVELSGNKNTYTLTKPGIYLIDYIVKTSKHSSQVQSFILKTIRHLFKHPGSVKTASLGVRGAEAPQEGFAWGNDEFTDYLKAGKDLLLQGEYSKARNTFADAVDSAFEDTEMEEANFYLAYTETLTGNFPKALADIKDVSPEKGTSYYNEAVLLKANLFIARNAPHKALAWIKSQETDAEAITDFLMLLKGIAHLQCGETQEAEALFNQLKKQYPDSESAVVAQEYLAKN